jgi:hypothetical protein
MVKLLLNIIREKREEKTGKEMLRQAQQPGKRKKRREMLRQAQQPEKKGREENIINHHLLSEL